MEYIIELKNLTKKFNQCNVLNNINLNIEKGKCYGFIGRNGSGKSVLFKIICGFIRPTLGTIRVNSKLVGIDIDFPENTGMLIENTGYLPNYTGFENLKLLASIQNLISEDTIKNIMQNVGLRWDNSNAVRNYSLGMRQRLGIAQAIMENQEILILDEPMNGLDKKGVSEIRKILLNLKQNNKTILISSHIKEDIDILCDLVFEIDNGTLHKMNNMSVSHEVKK